MIYIILLQYYLIVTDVMRKFTPLNFTMSYDNMELNINTCQNNVNYIILNIMRIRVYISTTYLKRTYTAIRTFKKWHNTILLHSKYIAWYLFNY